MLHRETVETPAAEQRLDVLARLAWVLGLGGIFMAGGLALGLALAIWQRNPAAILTGAAVGLAVGGLAMLALAAHDLLGALETATGRDLDHSGAIGDTPVLLRANASPVPAERDDFAAFVTACAVDTSARRWEPVLGRERYRQWRDVLIDGGWARWQSEDKRAGWELAADPAAILAALS